MLKQILTSCSLFYLITYLAVAQCKNTEYELIHKLLEDYDSSIRPTLNHNFSINVTFGLSLTQIIDIDERNMIVTTNCWLTQDWIDAHMKWNPLDYQNIKSVHIPVEKLWKPDILLVNNADQFTSISSMSTNLIVQHDGNVTWLSTVIFKSSCSINVKYFPFDEQICDLTFASWTFDMLRLNLDVNSQEGDSTNYIKNGEWHLVKLNATRKLKKYSCCEELYPEIIYTLVIRRRPLFYVFNMVFPCLLITLVAFLGFYLPPDSSEKVSIGITTLLSITVFLMLVAESMPPTSEELPLLGIYYAITICIVTFSTGFAVLTLNINNKGKKGEYRPPRLVRKIFFKYLAKFLRYKLSNDKKRKKDYRLISIDDDLGEDSSIRMDDFDEFSPKHNSLRYVRRSITRPEKLDNISIVSPTSNKRPTSLPAANLYSNFHNSTLVLKETYIDESICSKCDNLEKNSCDVTAKALEKVIQKQFGPLLKSINKLTNEMDEQKCTDLEREVIQNEWRDVAMISDQIICLIFSSMTIIACIIIFSNSPHIFPLSAW